MGFYQVRYKVGPNGEYQYPPKSKGVAWINVHYHNTELMMVAEADEEIAADGKAIVSLTDKQAKALIEEIRKSFPEPPKEGPPAQPKLP